jgi:excisionase family DNA binding protein
MKTIDYTRPSKDDQKTAIESYSALEAVLNELKTDTPEIEIEETQEKIKIPKHALTLLAKILKATSQGKFISIVPIATEMTTQAAAEFLGCSRPYLIKLLENGDIDFTLIGRHRRIKFEDMVKYKKQMKAKQKQGLINMMQQDEELGLYDS